MGRGLRVRTDKGVRLRREEVVAEARVEVSRLHPLGDDEELLEGHVDHHLVGECTR